MSISPVRAFALGVVSVFALAGVFVAGIVVGDTDVARLSGSAPLIDTPGVPARMVACPAPPARTAARAAHDRHALCELERTAQQVLLDGQLAPFEVGPAPRPR